MLLRSSGNSESGGCSADDQVTSFRKEKHPHLYVNPERQCAESLAPGINVKPLRLQQIGLQFSSALSKPSVAAPRNPSLFAVGAYTCNLAAKTPGVKPWDEFALPHP